MILSIPSSVLTHLNVLSVPTDKANFPEGWIERDVTCPLIKNKILVTCIIYKENDMKMYVTMKIQETYLCALMDFRHSHLFVFQIQMSPSSAPLSRCAVP